MIAIKGIRLDYLHLTREKENGQWKLEGKYSLMSNTDAVLATQAFNGYQDIKVELGVEEMKKQQAFISGVTEALKSILGLTEEK